MSFYSTPVAAASCEDCTTMTRDKLAKQHGSWRVKRACITVSAQQSRRCECGKTPVYQFTVLPCPSGDGRAKLNRDQALEIIAYLMPRTPEGPRKYWNLAQKHQARDEDKALGQKYGVHYWTIRLIRERRAWNEVWNEVLKTTDSASTATAGAGQPVLS